MQEILIKAGCYIAIILLGMGLRRIGFFKAEDFTILSKIVLKITLPASILINIAGMEIDPGMLVLMGLGLGCGVDFPLPLVVGRDIHAMFLAPLPYTQSTVPAL